MIELNPEISAVTIYSDRALVTRSMPLNLEPGEQTILLKYLPRKFQSDSLRIMLPGVEISSIDTKAMYEPASDMVDREGLRQELQQLQAEVEQSELDVVMQEEYLLDLRQQRESLTTWFAPMIAIGAKSLEEAMALQATQQEAYRDALRKKHELIQRKEQIRLRVTEIEKKLGEKQSRFSSAAAQNYKLLQYTARIEVFVAEPITTTLSASYFVDSVKWKAEYTLELQQAEVRLLYGAIIEQNSGEDWPQLRLKLSTAQLAKKAVIPQIRVWEISRIAPEYFEAEAKSRIRRAAEQFEPQTSQTIGTKLMYDSDDIRSEMNEQAEDETKGQVSVLDFQTEDAIVISDGKEVFTVLAEVQLPAAYDYVTVPKVDNQVVHRAKIFNNSRYTFLEGRVTIHENANILSRTMLPRTNSGEEIEYPLFYEDRVKLHRYLKEQQVTLLDEKTRQRRYHYHTRVENLLDRLITITLRDAMPVSLHEEVQVELLTVTPNPVEITERGILKWVLEIPAFETTEINFEFAINSPKEALISGIV